MSDLLLKSEFLTYFFVLIGIYSFLWYFCDVFASTFGIIKNILIDCVQRKTLKDKYGSWAVITGSSDGIGKRYAYELASRGINVVLISRTESKLVQIAADIKAKYSVETKWIAADFSAGETVYDHISRQLQGIQVGILVNNVGNMYDFPDEFENSTERTIWSVIYANIAAATFLTRTLVPEMKKNKKGAIVNVGSGVDIIPLPNGCVYSGAKAYIRSFTQALRFELKPFNITVQLVSPLMVGTNLMDFAGSLKSNRFIVACPDAYTKFTVFTLGKADETSGHWWHGIQTSFIKLAPLKLRMTIAYYITGYFKRQKYVNKSKV